MPLFLATDDVMKQVFRQIQFYRDGFLRYAPHPLIRYMKQEKFSRGVRDKWVIDELSQYQKGEITFEQLLKNEYQLEGGIEDLKLLQRKYGEGSGRYKEKEAEYAHLVYRRVRQRLVRRGIKPDKPSRGWWKKESELT